MVKVLMFKSKNKNKTRSSNKSALCLAGVVENAKPQPCQESPTIPTRIAPPMKKLLFEGAMSTTYIGQDKHTKQTVVVKVLTAAAKNSAYSAKREIAITTLVQSHPHIVRLVAVDNSDENKPSLSFQFATEGDVFDLLGRFEKDQLPHDLAQRCFAHVAGGLGHLHTNRVAWRDAKPENVLVTKDTKTQQLSFLITDFGLAEHHDDPNTPPTTNRCSGTKQFAAPEIFQTGPTRLHFDPFKADVWSLGILLYRIAFGKIPEIQKQLPDQGLRTPNSLLTIPNNTDPLLEDLLTKMLRVNPNLRPSMDHILSHPFVTTCT